MSDNKEILNSDDYTSLLEKYPNVLIWFNRYFEEVREKTTDLEKNSDGYKKFINSFTFDIKGISQVLEKSNDLVFQVTEKYLELDERIDLSFPKEMITPPFSKSIKQGYYNITELCFEHLNDLL